MRARAETCTLVSAVMVRVVVDTNVAGGKKSRPLTTIELRRLLDETLRGNLQLVVPEIVLRECSNLYADYLREHADALRNATSALRQADLLTSTEDLMFDRDHVRADTEKELRREITKAGGMVPPLPSVSHDRVVERALRRGQPFDSNGQNGYRDVLLWETILSLDADKDGVVLIAHDKRAFYDSDPSTGLAVVLRDEVEHQFGRPDAIAAFYEPAEGLTEALALAATSAERERQDEIEDQRRADEQAAERIRGLLDSDLSFLNLVAEAVNEALKYFDIGTDLKAFGISVDGLYDAYIEDVESLHDWAVASAHVAADNTVLCEFSAVVRALALATMPPPIAARLDDDRRVLISDYELGTPTAMASIDIAARVVVDLVIDQDSGALRSLATVSRFEPLDWDTRMDAT